MIFHSGHLVFENVQSVGSGKVAFELFIVAFSRIMLVYGLDKTNGGMQCDQMTRD